MPTASGDLAKLPVARLRRALGAQSKKEYSMSENTSFQLSSSDPGLLQKATRIAEAYTRSLVSEEIVGIVLLGAIARGYFDADADIDFGVFKRSGSAFELKDKFFRIDGIEVHVWLSDFEAEVTEAWGMSKRWTYSQGRIFHDTDGRVSRLLVDKVPLRADVRKWLLMSGLTLSEWYVRTLSKRWVSRGNIVSAHHMFDQGVTHFFDMLYGLNNALVPDVKWGYFYAERLARLPGGFQDRIGSTLICRALTLEELERRRDVFMEMWSEMKPVIEDEVQMSFDEMVQQV
jgi:hypothetical protein